jgi:6-phospho-3-hexuloisomerase
VGQEIIDLLARIDPASFESLVRIFADQDRRWFFSGQGRSGLSAQMAAMRFMHIGRDAHLVGEVTAPSVRKDDGLLLISGSGETPVSLNFAQIAKQENALVVVLTRNPQSSIAQIADLVVPVPVESSEQFGGSLFEQASLILLDSVILGMIRGAPDTRETMRYRHTNMQ